MVIIDEHDIGKTREELLMDLIYETNGQRIPLDKIKFGIPREVDQRPDLDNDPNTFIPVTIDSSYDDRFGVGVGGLMYRRHDLSLYMKDVDLTVITPLSLPFTIQDILEQVNDQLPYPIDPLEVINYEYKTIEQAEFGVTLKARDGAYIWFHGVHFQVNTGLLDGSPLISNTNLDGFKPFRS